MRFELGIKVLSPTHNSKSVETEALTIEIIDVSKEIVNITIIIFFELLYLLRNFFILSILKL